METPPSLRTNLSWLIAWVLLFTAIATHGVEYLWRTVQMDFMVFALASLGCYLFGLILLAVLWRHLRSK